MARKAEEKCFSEREANFTNLRKQYQSARNVERLRIVHELKDRDYEVSYCQGTYRYTSRGVIKPPFNLGSWKWIHAHRDGVTAIIDLQILEQDRVTKNVHAWIDRIGVDVFIDPNDDLVSEDDDRYFRDICRRYNVTSIFDKPYLESIVTKYTLPLSDSDLGKLCDAIDKKVDELK